MQLKHLYSVIVFSHIVSVAWLLHLPQLKSPDNSDLSTSLYYYSTFNGTGSLFAFDAYRRCNWSFSFGLFVKGLCAAAWLSLAGEKEGVETEGREEHSSV